MIFGANLSDVKIRASAQEGKIHFQRIIQVSISKCETTVFLSPVLCPHFNFPSNFPSLRTLLTLKFLPDLALTVLVSGSCSHGSRLKRKCIAPISFFFLFFSLLLGVPRRRYQQDSAAPL